MKTNVNDVGRLRGVVVAVTLLGVGGLCAVATLGGGGSATASSTPTTLDLGDLPAGASIPEEYLPEERETTLPDFDDTDIVDAAAGCDALGRVADGGHSIVFDDAAVGDAPFAANCVVDALMPEWAGALVFATRETWGLVRTEANGYVMLNSYGHGSGFVAIYEAP